VVIIGFLVYLMVIVFLDTGYLQPIEDIAAETGDDVANAPVSLTEVPTETYRMLLFHSVLIQAVGTGFIAGKLADDSVQSGLKYSIALVAVTLLTFTIIQ
jgi:flagellar protein FlaJ